MPSKVFPLRASEEERAKWQRSAEAQGISFNAWARRALNEQAALEAALRRQEERDGLDRDAGP